MPLEPRTCEVCRTPVGPDELFRCHVGRCWQYDLVYCEDCVEGHDHGLSSSEEKEGGAGS